MVENESREGQRQDTPEEVPTEHGGIIVVKVDFDKTLVTAKHTNLFLRKLENGPLKAPYKSLPGAAEGIQRLKDEKDIAYGGIVTARNKYGRPYTGRQVRKFIGDEEITYTSTSSERKIIDLLETAEEQERQNDTAPEVKRTVLIDDKVDDVRKAAIALAKDPHYKELMKQYGFTLVAFQPKIGTNLESLPDGAMDVIKMTDWSRESLDTVLKNLRTKSSHSFA